VLSKKLKHKTNYVKKKKLKQNKQKNQPTVLDLGNGSLDKSTCGGSSLVT